MTQSRIHDIIQHLPLFKNTELHGMTKSEYWRKISSSLRHLRRMQSEMTVDRYAEAEKLYGLAVAADGIAEHVRHLLRLCDEHQNMRSWAEAAECALAAAGVIMQALVQRVDAVWTKENVAVLREMCPMVSSEITARAYASRLNGDDGSELTVQSAVKYLYLANDLFIQAKLYNFCESILKLILPIYKSCQDFGQLAKCHTAFARIYESMHSHNHDPIPCTDARYYRVGFYGHQLEDLNGREYVYREPYDVRLGDIMEKLRRIYEAKLKGKQLNIIQDSKQVKVDELPPAGICHLQITTVEPIMDDERSMHARVFNRFSFETHFRKNPKTQGGLEDLWKRRTLVQTESSFPALVYRLLVIKSETREFSPLQNAIEMIETRTAALRELINSEGNRLPHLQNLQRVLQGSVAVQVNGGVLEVCTSFLSGKPATKLQPQELQQLINTLLEFIDVCKRALLVHSQLIGDEDQDYHTELMKSFQSLTAEISRYVPAILSEL